MRHGDPEPRATRDLARRSGFLPLQGSGQAGVRAFAEQCTESSTACNGDSSMTLVSATPTPNGVTYRSG
ncbi:MAG: hypothetical protein HYV07_16590 [Deltaproteobacteria bacterium]|nr:hypothetical protein [Deltaproteobacteria bacterium]